MATYAAEQTKLWIDRINGIHASTTVMTMDEPATVNISTILAASRGIRYKNGAPMMPGELLQHIRDTQSRLQSALARRTGKDEANLQALYCANIVVQALGGILQALLQQARQINETIEYWRCVEQRSSEKAFYLIQSKSLVIQFDRKLSRSYLSSSYKARKIGKNCGSQRCQVAGSVKTLQPIFIPSGKIAISSHTVGQ